MRGLLLAGVLLVVVGLVVLRAEPLGPTATLDDPPGVVGPGTTLAVTATDRGSGLAAMEVRLVPEGEPQGMVLASADFPRTSWLGSGVKSHTLTAPLANLERPLADGPARLEVRVKDHSWLSALRSEPQLTQTITIDATPPTVTDLESSVAASLGGSAVGIYRVSEDTAQSGIAVGELFFPGKPLAGADPGVRVTLFAIPHDGEDARPVLVAVDAAGNRRETPLRFAIKPRKFVEKTLAVDDAFLERKVPALLAENQLPPAANLLEGYLLVNRDLRRTTEAKVRSLCAESGTEPHWGGGFGRLPNSDPLSGYGDRRTYVHKGEKIDHQTHLGFDLASLKRADVPSANAGRVVFAGPLGIYGTTVIVDHGLGLFTLYGHLSETAVKAGDTVERGTLLGKTGETGLAGGDHLHFSTMIHGTHVDPVEWWDAHWIHDRIELRMAAATTPAEPAPTASAREADGRRAADDDS
jgi:murein DD-endopeptidase MepM/ murein hydrolase activator NlpD